MAVPLRQSVVRYDPPPVLRPDQDRAECEHLLAVVVAVLSAAGIGTIQAWSF